MTDNELNALIESQDRTVWGFDRDANGFDGNGRLCAYDCYIEMGLWKGMDLQRMVHILEVMHGCPKYNAMQKIKIHALLSKLS